MTRLMPLTALLAALTGCGFDPGAVPASDGPREVLLDDGRADNYVSTNAREFDLLGQAHATTPEGFASLSPEEQASRLDGLVQTRLATVARAIRSHIEAAILAANDGQRGEDTRFFTYFRRNNEGSESVEVLEDGRVRLDFAMELVGSYYLMSVLAPGEASRRTFTVTVADWNGSEREDVVVEIRGSTSRDAFPRYDELFADGVYDIAVHFGGDYNAERLDISTARWTVDYLLSGGWSNETVAAFEDLTIDSPPFTRTLLVEGRPVEARVHIYHSDMVEPAEEQRLADVMRLSFAERDVVIYSGHAGEGSGFVLDYQPSFEIRPSEFPSLPLADRYQIYVFDGCRTYRTYVDDIMRNERKTFENVDIVTTVNTTPFSAGYQLIHEFLYWLTLTDSYGSHYPLSWTTILRGLNSRRFRSVHYGVHGIDENPRLNPHGHEGVMCRPCQTDADCGAGGNLCLSLGGTGVCGVACTEDTACGAGNRCARLTTDPDLFFLSRQCIPRDYRCETP